MMMMMMRGISPFFIFCSSMLYMTTFVMAMSIAPNLNKSTSTSTSTSASTSTAKSTAKSTASFSHQSAHERGIVDIRVASKLKGLGAFANTLIPMGTLLGEYKGEMMTKEEVGFRFWGRGASGQGETFDQDNDEWIESRKDRNQSITGNYLMENPNDGMYIDCEDEDVSTWCRFINHADGSTDDCNVKAFMQSEIDGDFHTWPQMYAIHDVQIGEELCFGKMCE